MKNIHILILLAALVVGGAVLYYMSPMYASSNGPKQFGNSSLIAKNKKSKPQFGKKDPDTGVPYGTGAGIENFFG